MSASDPLSDADPYSKAKDNLRDTIKWLAATFSALAAVVIAGSPLSGLGALSPAGEKFWWATLALFVAFACICSALVITLRLLRSDILYPSDLDSGKELGSRKDKAEIEELRTNVEIHAADLLPWGFSTLAQLLKRIKEERDAYDAMEDEDPGLQTTEQTIEKFVSYQDSILAYAAYLRFYNRLRRAAPWLFLFGTCALGALLFFGSAVQSNKAAELGTTTTLVNLGDGPALTERPAPAAGYPALEPVFFDPGHAEITRQGLASATLARDALRDHPAAGVLLRAYTDTVAAQRVNAGLARRRAIAVRNLLIETGGIAPSRVFIAELPKSSLPQLTGADTADQSNRSVSLQMFTLETP